MNSVRLTDAQRRVYLLLREGCAQSLVVKRTGLPKGTVSKIASKLVREGFLERVTDIQPYLYGDGPRSKELDKIVVAQQLSESANGEVSTNGTGVKQVSPEAARVNLVRSHHIKVRFLVEKIGDSEILRVKQDELTLDVPFLEKAPYFDYRSVRRTKGTLSFPGGRYSVELEEGPKATWFYIHLPELQLTKEEVEGWQKTYSEKAQHAANFIQKWGGWRFGLMEFCERWKPHFSTEDPRFLQQLVGKLGAKNHDGSVWLSDSEGRRELETSDPELAQVIVSFPEEVLELRTRVTNIIQILKLMIEADEDLAMLEASRLEKETVKYGLNGKD